ncbi:MAG: hypothetical protein ACE5HO_07665 [bacterium]
MSLLTDYKVKLVSLLFAVIIWFFVVTENEYEHVIDVPIITQNVPKGKVILNDLPATAKVKVQGSGKSLIGLSMRPQIRVELDLSGVRNSKSFAMDPKKVNLARSSGSIKTIEIVNPDSVHIVLDDFAKKKIAVVPNIKVTPAFGHTIVGDLMVNPDSVVIQGPKSIVSEITSINTAEEMFVDVMNDIKKTIALAPLPSKKVKVLQNQVTVSLDIQKLLEMRVSEVPVKVRNAPRNMIVHVIPSTLSLVLEGGAELLSTVKPEDINVYIDYARIRMSPGNEHPAVIEQPKGVSYRDVTPKLFKIVLEPKSSN